METVRQVVVTGGAQGIGRAITQRLLNDGWSVAIVDADRTAGEELVARLSAGGRLAFLHGDVGVPDEIARLCREIRNWSGERLGALINNAGFGDWAPLAELTPERWNRVLAVDLSAAFLMTRELTSALSAGAGSIVNIASTRAHQSEPDSEAYAAAKGGLVALTHALAISLGPRIRVNCISPGWIDVSAWKRADKAEQEALSEEDHRQHPAGRVGRPEDVAALVAWLTGPEAGFVTGAEYVTDGGMSRRMIYA